MVIENKKTTVAYRCPYCGAGIMTFVDAFKLNADMVKLKCDCKQSDMMIEKAENDKVRLTIPCLICPKPHTFLLNKSLFYGKDSFYLSCPYSDLNIGFIGDENYVKADLAKSELELLDLMEKNGISDFSAFHKKIDENETADPETLSMIKFLVGELDADGKITCKCNGEKYDGKYEIIFENGGVLVKCKDCGASHFISADNYLSAQSFVDVDNLILQ